MIDSQMFCPPHHLAGVQRMEWLSAQFPLLNPVQSGRILNIFTVSLLMA